MHFTNKTNSPIKIEFSILAIHPTSKRVGNLIIHLYQMKSERNPVHGILQIEVFQDTTDRYNLIVPYISLK
jgi:hypothetical protein